MEEVIDKKEEKYLIKIDNFEGPFDLLCYLIDKNKMDIFNIKLDEVIEQYIEYMQEMERLDLDIASEFVVMAATLIYIKSKKLLPLLEPEEEEEEITELEETTYEIPAIVDLPDQLWMEKEIKIPVKIVKNK